MPHKPRFCTVCGRSVPLTVHGHPMLSRHVYGLISEPRCSKHHADPVVDVETQRTIERMGDIVVAYRMQHGLTVRAEDGAVTIGGGLPR